MASDEKDEIQDIIKSFELGKSDTKDLFDFVVDLRDKGIAFLPSNFIFRRAEFLHNKFVFNRIIDFTTRQEPRVTWEISTLGEGAYDLYNPLSHFQSVPNQLYENLLDSHNKDYDNLKQLIEELTELKTHDKRLDIKMLIEEISKVKAEFKELQNETVKLKEQNEELKNTIFSQIIFSDKSTKEKIQNIPVEIYIDTDNAVDIFNTYQAVIDFLKNIGFEKSIEFKPIKGSWFKRFIARSQSVFTDKEVTDRLKEAEYGVEVNTILKPQSEVDKNNSEALSNILKSIEHIPNAAIRIGSLIVVKATNIEGEANIQVRTLSIKELHLLNKKPELLFKPSEVLVALAREIGNTNASDILQN